MSEMDKLLNALNPQQKEAVMENSVPLLVLAGAGSGKTRVITTKIAYAVSVLGIPPRRILAVTFTNKAANEMKERACSMLSDRSDMKECVIRTFHSFGAWILRMFADDAGLSSDFTIYDDDASLEVLRKAYAGYDAKVLRGYAKKISLLKDRGVDEATILKSPDHLLGEMYRKYQQTLGETGCVDFADLILRTVQVLDKPEVSQWAHNRFRMILVDEYQDTNVMQFQLLRKLAAQDAMLCVVGDDDQSIYRFRGAEVGNIDSFRRAYPNVRTIKLEQNYRSTPSILDVANSVIVHNHKGGDLKRLWTDNDDGPKPALFFLPDERAEASLVAQMIKENGDYDHTAVLFRTNAQSGLFEQEFVKPGLAIPYKVVGALKFYDREQVKDGLSLMYLLCNRKDVVSFRRMVNKPSRGIGKTALAAIEATAEANGNDYIEALRNASLTGKAKDGALSFYDLLAKCNALLEEEKLTDALQNLFSQSGLIASYVELDKKEGKEREEGGRVADFDTLVTQASNYGNDRAALSSFLETLALDTTTIGYLDPSDRPGVTLITMHNTKGLEYENVYVVGLEEGLFPSSMSIDEDPSCDEERRIFYVAVTRAKRRLVLTSCRRRRLYGTTRYNQPSRFLGEIGKGLVEEHEESPQASSFGWNGMGSLGERRLHRPSTGDGTRPRQSVSFGFSGSSLLHKGFGEKSQGFSYEVTHAEATDGSIFQRGQRVNSGTYGSGYVQEVKKSGSQEVITVRFDSGKVATFLSKYAKLEKISD
ncbi:MAG: UvrD-helicase domain-containing protein [Sphaerochaetaceae bacterium]